MEFEKCEAGGTIVVVFDERPYQTDRVVSDQTYPAEVAGSGTVGKPVKPEPVMELADAFGLDGFVTRGTEMTGRDLGLGNDGPRNAVDEDGLRGDDRPGSP
jgi:hypothetical protein